MFGNEVQPKPTSLGHAYGRSSPKSRHRPPGPPAKIASTPCTRYHLVLLPPSGGLQVQLPSPFIEGPGYISQHLAHVTLVLLITTQVHYIRCISNTSSPLPTRLAGELFPGRALQR
jgi:hypothetical protein